MLRIVDSSTAKGRFVRQNGPPGHFAVVEIHLGPLPHADGPLRVEFANALPMDDPVNQYADAISEGVLQAALAANIGRCRVTLLSGRFHAVDSNAHAYRAAAEEAFAQALLGTSTQGCVSGDTPPELVLVGDDAKQRLLWGQLASLCQPWGFEVLGDGVQKLAGVGSFDLNATSRPGILRNAANVLLMRLRIDGKDCAFAALCDGNYKDEGCAVAAAILVLELRTHLELVETWNDVEPAFIGAVNTANTLIEGIGREAWPIVAPWNFDSFFGQRTDLQGIASCMTAVVARGDEAIVAHVGDGRACILRDAVLEQLTVDHTLANVGGYEPGDVDPTLADNVLTRVVGFQDAPPEVDIVRVALHEGDSLLIGSTFLRPKLESGAHIERPRDLVNDVAENTPATLVELAPSWS